VGAGSVDSESAVAIGHVCRFHVPLIDRKQLLTLSSRSFIRSPLSAERDRRKVRPVRSIFRSQENVDFRLGTINEHNVPGRKTPTE